MHPSNRVRPDRLTWIAFTMFVVLVAVNVVGIRFSNRELPPFWGAGIRLAFASLIFLLYMAMKRYPIPRGRALRGPILFAILEFGFGLGLGYWILVEVPAGTAAVILASIPLFTLVFASAVRIETLSTRGVLGSLVSIGGIAVIFGEGVGTEIPPIYLLAAIVTAASFALVPVVLKLFPPVHPSSMNGVGMLFGALLLLGISFITGETATIPNDSATWVAFLYLVLFGSVGVFALLQFLVQRWTASGVSYQTVLSPFVTMILSAWLLGEPITSRLLLGAILVILGVYIGAIAPGMREQSGS